jgi:hypothetical protein
MEVNFRSQVKESTISCSHGTKTLLFTVPKLDLCVPVRYLYL